MTKETDITGLRFGRLIAIRKDTGSNWLFKCDCGNEKSIYKYSVTKGETTSCGCFAKEQRRKSTTKHGLWKHPLFQKWTDIKNRCYNPHRQKYKIYGGRGIVMCDEWKNDFKSFYDWAIASGWKPELSIDRIDVNGNYCPENCRWATPKEQANNTRTNKKITINGITENLTFWLKKYAMSYGSYYYKTQKGLTPEEIFV